jgi:aspartate aminotransferase
MKDHSTLLQSVPPSATVAVSDKARRLKAEGRDVIALAGGDPDFATPQHIIDAAVEALNTGDTHYPPAKGKPELIEAIVAKLARENDVQITPEQVVVTPGGKWALYIALQAMLNPGDEVLLLEPAWVSYGPIVTLNGGQPVHVTLPSHDNFRVTDELLLEHMTPRTKALIVNNPSNPTGRVLTRDEIGAIVRVATNHDLYVISDEIYEHLVYDNAVHYSLAAQPGMAERTVTVNGFSKAYAMTGWRLGWLAAPPDLARLALKLQTQSVTSAASFAMVGGAAALNGPQDAVHRMVAAYAERRAFMLDALDEIPGIECRPIEGAFYLFPSFPNSSKTSLELADALLDEAEIAATPGIAFGGAGEGHVRFTIATAMADLERAVERLADVVPRL